MKKENTTTKGKYWTSGALLFDTQKSTISHHRNTCEFSFFLRFYSENNGCRCGPHYIDNESREKAFFVLWMRKKFSSSSLFLLYAINSEYYTIRIKIYLFMGRHVGFYPMLENPHDISVNKFFLSLQPLKFHINTYFCLIFVEKKGCWKVAHCKTQNGFENA